MTFDEELKELKEYFKARNFRHLSEILGISYATIDGWKRRKNLPKKYKKHIHNIRNICQNDIKNEIKNDFVKLVNELDDKKLEYYYHKIKSDILEEEIKK